MLWTKKNTYPEQLSLSPRRRKKELCEFLHSVKVLSGYSSNIVRLVSVKELKINFAMMKSHDCHVMMTSLLAVAIRNILPIKVRDGIMSLCFFFNAIEQKVLDLESPEELEKRQFETLCILEVYVPPSFFDTMVHLTAHLVNEIQYLGPVLMFPYERYICGT